MISIENDIEVAESVAVNSIEVGATFLGTVPDVNGTSRTGLFLRTATTVVFLDDLDYEFDEASFIDDDFVATNYKEVDINITVSEV